MNRRSFLFRVVLAPLAAVLGVKVLATPPVSAASVKPLIKVLAERKEKTFLDFHDEHLWNELMYGKDWAFIEKCEPPTYTEDIQYLSAKIQKLLDTRFTQAGEDVADMLSYVTRRTNLD